ncbi:MAG: hypothetical protein EPO02_06325, partial [Nitrospirae bacterium]
MSANNPVLVPVAVLGSTAPDWLEWAWAKAIGGYVLHKGASTPAKGNRKRKADDGEDGGKSAKKKGAGRRYIVHRGPTHVVLSWVLGLACGLWVWD